MSGDTFEWPSHSRRDERLRSSPLWKLELLSDHKAKFYLAVPLEARIEREHIAYKLDCLFLGHRCEKARIIQNKKRLNKILKSLRERIENTVGDIADDGTFTDFNTNIEYKVWFFIFDFYLPFGIYHTLFHSVRNNNKFNHDVNTWDSHQCWRHCESLSYPVKTDKIGDKSADSRNDRDTSNADTPIPAHLLVEPKVGVESHELVFKFKFGSKTFLYRRNNILIGLDPMLQYYEQTRQIITSTLTAWSDNMEIKHIVSTLFEYVPYDAITREKLGQNSNFRLDWYGFGAPTGSIKNDADMKFLDKNQIDTHRGSRPKETYGDFEFSQEVYNWYESSKVRHEACVQYKDDAANVVNNAVDYLAVYRHLFDVVHNVHYRGRNCDDKKHPLGVLKEDDLMTHCIHQVDTWTLGTRERGRRVARHWVMNRVALGCSILESHKIQEKAQACGEKCKQKCKEDNEIDQRWKDIEHEREMKLLREMGMLDAEEDVVVISKKMDKKLRKSSRNGKGAKEGKEIRDFGEFKEIKEEETDAETDTETDEEDGEERQVRKARQERQERQESAGKEWKDLKNVNNAKNCKDRKEWKGWKGGNIVKDGRGKGKKKCKGRFERNGGNKCKKGKKNKAKYINNGFVKECVSLKEW